MDQLSEASLTNGDPLIVELLNASINHMLDEEEFVHLDDAPNLTLYFDGSHC